MKPAMDPCRPSLPDEFLYAVARIGTKVVSVSGWTAEDIMQKL